MIAKTISAATSVRSGQTLVEVMVALFVLVTGLLGILSLLAQSLLLSRTVENNVTATYLASEGIELAKNLIDHDVYEHIAGLGTGWETCFIQYGPHGDYELDYTTQDCGTIQQYSTSDFLSYDPGTHRYLYSYNDIGGNPVPSQFLRDVRVVINGDEISVTSIVSWASEPGFPFQNVTLEDDFYNWYPTN